MTLDKDTKEIFTPKETLRSSAEDITPSDDAIDVEFGDPKLMGDEFDFMVEYALNHMSPEQLIDWMAEQIRAFSARMERVTRLMDTSATLQLKLDAQNQIITELCSQILSQSTHN
jgi:hypothetical protein